MNAILDIMHRPFSVETITGVMLPDGVFDGSVPAQSINFFLYVISQIALNNVQVYLEGIGDGGIVISPNTLKFSTLNPGDTVLCTWLADFGNSSPGKTLLSVRVAADGQPPVRMLATIFVSRTVFDPLTSSYICQTPEAILKLRVLETSGPPAIYVPSPDGRKKLPIAGPWVIRRATIELDHVFVGQFGPLAFNDPWWKIVAIVVAVIAALAAVILASKGYGQAKAGLQCDYDENTGGTTNCRMPDPEQTKGKTEVTAAGIASSIASGAIRVALSDAIDPFRRGQEATLVEVDEKTLSERLDFTLTPLADLIAGEPNQVQCSWLYTRTTNKGVYHASAVDVQTNSHLLGTKSITAPARAQITDNSVPVVVKLNRPDGSFYKGSELYVTLLARPPAGQGGEFRLVLTDPSRTGNYAGVFDLRKAVNDIKELREIYLGDWRLYIVAQDVNLASSVLSPLDAAKIIGGVVVASPVSVVMTSVTCPVQAPDALISVYA